MSIAVRNITWISLISATAALQLMVLVVWGCHGVPIKPMPIVAEVAESMRSYFFLERDIFFYRLALVAGAIIQAALVFFFRRRLEERELAHDLEPFFYNAAFWLVLQISAGLSIVLGQGAWLLFYISATTALLTQIFWPEIRKLIGRRHQLILPAGALICGGVAFINVMGALHGGVALLACVILTQNWRQARWLIVPVLMAFLSFVFKPSALFFLPQLGLLVVVLLIIGLCLWIAPRTPLSITWPALSGKAAGIIFSVVLAACLFIPNMEAVIARAYVGEQVHHIDMFIMAPGWASLKGARMDVDQICQYGVGMPGVIAHLAQVLGGFNYVPVLNLIMWGCIVYFILWFWLLRWWWGSGAIAMATVVAGIALQMFHPGVYPLVFTYPSTTVMRHPLDIVFFAGLLIYVRTDRWMWLVMSAVACGVSIFYLDSTGLSMLVAFAACLGVLGLRQPSLPPGLKLAGLLALAGTLALVLFYWAVGDQVWTKTFWHQMTETAEYFISGIGNHPMHNSFLEGRFWTAVWGYVIPCIYGFTFLNSAALLATKRGGTEHIWPISVSVYGLGLYHYYIAHSIGISYGPAILPVVFLIGGWLQKYKTWHVPVLAVVSILLMVNPMWHSYPHVWDAGKNPMVNPAIAKPLPDGSTYFAHLFRHDPESAKLPLNSLGSADEQLFTESDFANDEQLVDYFHKDFDFAKDAHLIDSITSPSDKVPVISSFETRILMQADRRPFFYYFPLLNARPKHMRTLVFNFLHTSTLRYNSKALNQLEEEKPPFIFMEKIFLNENVPDFYALRGENILAIINYVQAKYVPYTEGEYLVVMKRKGNDQ